MGPLPPAMSRPPSTMPSRIASEVPISTMPLPPTSSAGSSACGRMAYLIGPEQGWSAGHQEQHDQQQVASWVWKPHAASAMAAISNSFT